MGAVRNGVSGRRKFLLPCLKSLQAGVPVFSLVTGVGVSGLAKHQLLLAKADLSEGIRSNGKAATPPRGLGLLPWPSGFGHLRATQPGR